MPTQRVRAVSAATNSKLFMKHDSINKSSQRFLSDVIRKIISTESMSSTTTMTPYRFTAW